MVGVPVRDLLRGPAADPARFCAADHPPGDYWHVAGDLRIGGAGSAGVPIAWDAALVVDCLAGCRWLYGRQSRRGTSSRAGPCPRTDRVAHPVPEDLRAVPTDRRAQI